MIANNIGDVKPSTGSSFGREREEATDEKRGNHNKKAGRRAKRRDRRKNSDKGKRKKDRKRNKSQKNKSDMISLSEGHFRTSTTSRNKNKKN
jgi:hypothetical protein